MTPSEPKIKMESVAFPHLAKANDLLSKENEMLSLYNKKLEGDINTLKRKLGAKEQELKQEIAHAAEKIEDDRKRTEADWIETVDTLKDKAERAEGEARVMRWNIKSCLMKKHHTTCLGSWDREPATKTTAPEIVGRSFHSRLEECFHKISDLEESMNANLNRSEKRKREDGGSSTQVPKMVKTEAPAFN